MFNRRLRRELAEVKDKLNALELKHTNLDAELSDHLFKEFDYNRVILTIADVAVKKQGSKYIQTWNTKSRDTLVSQLSKLFLTQIKDALTEVSADFERSLQMQYSSEHFIDQVVQRINNKQVVKS